MTWYLKQVKIAAPKDKIRRFNVTDPVLQVFIQQYEKLVDWNKVKNEDEIQDYIYDILMPTVISQIERDSPNNVYIKDVDLESQAQQLENDPTFVHHPQYQQAMQAMQWYRMYPDQAKNQALQIVNDEKEKVLDKWWNYLTEVNEEYSDNPAWMYIVMNSLVKSSPETSQGMPMTLNAEALAEIYYGLKENPVPFNFVKKYQEVSAKVDARNAEFVATDASGENGWISIPGQKNDPQNFEENVEKLIRFSYGNDWCTAAGGATGFLKQGNFWLYLEGGRATVAIRTLDTGNQELAAEIQGPGNNPPMGQVQQIKQFIESKPDIVWDKAIHYEALMGVMSPQEQSEQPELAQEIDDEDWEKMQAEWDAFNQDYPEDKIASSNWYKKAQQIKDYFDIGHVGWNFSGLEQGTIQQEEKLWIIDENWQLLEENTGIAELHEKGVENAFTGKSHGKTWPHLSESDIATGIITENYIARGRYEKNQRGEAVSAMMPGKLREIKNVNPRKYEYIQKRVDRMLERQYPSATIYWFD